MTLGGDQTSSTGRPGADRIEPEPSSKVTRVSEPQLLAEPRSRESVSEVRLPDEDVRSLQDRFRLLFEHTPAAVAMVDRARGEVFRTKVLALRAKHR